MVGKVTPDTMASGSMVPSIMGHHPYQSQNDSLRRVIGAHKGEPRPELEDREPADWGDLLETTILEQKDRNVALIHQEYSFRKLRKNCMPNV